MYSYWRKKKNFLIQFFGHLFIWNDFALLSHNYWHLFVVDFFCKLLLVNGLSKSNVVFFFFFFDLELSALVFFCYYHCLTVFHFYIIGTSKLRIIELLQYPRFVAWFFFSVPQELIFIRQLIGFFKLVAFFFSFFWNNYWYLILSWNLFFYIFFFFGGGKVLTTELTK